VVQRELEDPTDRESVSLGGASPLSPTNLKCKVKSAECKI